MRRHYNDQIFDPQDMFQNYNLFNFILKTLKRLNDSTLCSCILLTAYVFKHFQTTWMTEISNLHFCKTLHD